MALTAADFTEVEQDLDKIKAWANTAASTIVMREGATLSTVKGIADALAGVSIADTVANAASAAGDSIANSVSAVDAAATASTLDMESKRDAVSGHDLAVRSQMDTIAAGFSLAEDALLANLQSAHDASSLDMESKRNAVSAKDAAVRSGMDTLLAGFSSAVTLGNTSLSSRLSAFDSIADSHEVGMQATHDSLSGVASDFSAAIAGWQQDGQNAITDLLDDVGSLQEVAGALIDVMVEDWEREIDSDLLDLKNTAHTQLDDVITASLATLAAYEAVAAGAAGPFLPYDSYSELTADLSPVADKLALVKSNLTLYRKVGGSGTGSWDVFAVLKDGCHSRDFGIVANGYSGSPTNQFAAAEVMYAAAIAAGHGKVVFDPPTTAGEAYLINGWSDLVDSLDLEVHPDAVIHGTNNVPWHCTRCDGAEAYLPSWTRTSIDGGGSPRDEHFHQPDLVYAWDGLLYALYHHNPYSNEEGDDGQIVKMKRRESGGTWTDLGSPWYDGETATNPWNPGTNNEKMWQPKFIWTGSALIVTQCTGRDSDDNGLMWSVQTEKDGDWVNKFFWFSDADASPILTTDLTAPSGYSHQFTIGGVTYHPYVPGGRNITDDGAYVIHVTGVPDSGGTLDTLKKLHISLYSEDEGSTWKWGKPQPTGELQAPQLWEKRVARVRGSSKEPARYVAFGRVRDEDGSVTENAGRFHAISFSADCINFTPWVLLQSELPLESVCPIAINGTHLIYPGSNSKVRRTAQSLNLSRFPFTNIIAGPRASAEEPRGENYYRHDPDDGLDTIFNLDFNASGVAGRFRGRVPDGTWETFSQTAGDYTLSIGAGSAVDAITYLGGLATDYVWMEYRELTGELAAVSCAAVNYATGEIAMAWSQNRQADEQTGGTEIVVAVTTDLPKPNKANVMPTDAAELDAGEAGHSFDMDLVNNVLTLYGKAYAAVDYPRDKPLQIAMPFKLADLPVANDPAIIASFGDVQDFRTVDYDNDGGRRYRRVRRTSQSGSVGSRHQTVPQSNPRVIDPSFGEALTLILEDPRVGWAVLQDDVYFETSPRAVLKLGDGQYISEAPANRALVFDLAKASFDVRPGVMAAPMVKTIPAWSENRFTDAWGRDPRHLRKRVLLQAGQFFWPNWRCITTGGAEVYASIGLFSIDVANDDAGGDRRYYRFEVESTGSSELIVEHLWEGPDALFGMLHTLQLQIRDTALGFDAVTMTPFTMDWYTYPDGNFFAGAAASFMGRSMAADWTKVRGVLPIPLWEDNAAKPLSLDNAMAGLRFVFDVSSNIQPEIRFFDFYPGVGDRDFVRPLPQDQQHRIDRVMQVHRPARRNDPLATGGGINDNGDGSFSLRAGVALTERMLRSPKATFDGKFAARGRSGANVILETFSPTLIDSNERSVVIGTDTLSGTSWNDGMFADIIGLDAPRETFEGGQGLRECTLSDIISDDPDDIIALKINAASGTETLAQGTDFIYYPPKERKHVGEFTGDGGLMQIETTLALSQSGIDVAVWGSGVETLLGSDEFVVTQGASSTDPDTLSLNASVPNGAIVDLWEANSADTFAHANFLDNVETGTTMIVEDTARNDSAMILEAHPGFYGQVCSATAAWLATFSTPPTGQLQEALDRFIARAVAWGLWADADACLIHGLHNETDGMRDAIRIGTSATPSGTRAFRRHYGIDFTGSSDGVIDTALAADAGGNFAQDSGAVMVFAQAVTPGALTYLLGGPTQTRLLPNNGSGGQFVSLNNTTADSGSALTNASGEPAFWGMTRQASGTYDICVQSKSGRFRNRAIATASSTVGTGNFLLNAHSTKYSQHQILGFVAGKGWTVAEMRRWSILWHELARHLGELPYYDS